MQGFFLFDDGAQTFERVARQGRLTPDLWMEKEDIGLELARSASKLTPRPVIVIFTGYGSATNARAALGVPVDYFALKPLDVEELKRVLNRLVVANAAEHRWTS